MSSPKLGGAVGQWHYAATNLTCDKETVRVVVSPPGPSPSESEDISAFAGGSSADGQLDRPPLNTASQGPHKRRRPSSSSDPSQSTGDEAEELVRAPGGRQRKAEAGD